MARRSFAVAPGADTVAFRDAFLHDVLAALPRFGGHASPVVVPGCLVRSWQPCMREAGVSEVDAAKVRSAFCNPGFGGLPRVRKP